MRNILYQLLGVWDDFDDIDFSILPDRFVLKCNHDSGSIVSARIKTHLILRKLGKKCEKD